MVSWVLDCNILEILHYRTHCLIMRRRSGRQINDIQLIGFKLLSHRSNKCIRVFRCPEVYVESVKSEKILSLATRICIREPPVMFGLLNRRRCALGMAAIAVDYDGTQGRMFV